jgi:lipopolysaccharide export system protein LptA
VIARTAKRAARTALGVLCALAIGTTAVMAQGLGLGGGKDDKPLEVFADQGIEWHQNESTYIARGNARAVKGDTTVYGDTLTAHYRKAASGATEVWRVESNGNVRITTPTDTAFGDRAVYTIDNGVLVMTGKNLRLNTPREKITARDSLEYWEQKDLAVARGEAIVVTDGRRIRADVLTAQFKNADQRAATPTSAKPTPAKPGAKPPARPNQKPAPQGASTRDESRLHRLDAFGNVIITTPEEVARGNRGVYMEETGIANLMGSVKITRGQNQLNGEAAEVNLRTGVSRIVSTNQGTGGPVRALIVPERKPEDAAAPPAAGPPSRPAN